MKKGQKIIKNKIEEFNLIGSEEINAARKVVKSKCLSKFLGESLEDYFGGPKVRSFEKQICNFYKVKYSILVNSWTSGLVAAIGSLDLEPGDEVITSPWTMCASATSILQWNAIPIFADIKKNDFTLDPVSVEKNITKKTKAILTVDVFGKSSDMKALKKIANKYKLKIISDSAQSPYSYFNKKLTGTLADVGGYSFNYHKHITTGEGGVLVTNSKKIYQKLALIRNHGEAVVDKFKGVSLVNVLGNNFRLGEIESAIGIEQLKKLKKRVKKIHILANKFINLLSDLDGLILPKKSKVVDNSYYVFPIVLDLQKIKVPRDKIILNLKKKGLNCVHGGYRNVHLLPIYQKKIAYGSKGFPWTADFSRKNISYKKGICPNAEELNDKSFIAISFSSIDINQNLISLFSKCFHEVWKELKLPFKR